MQGKTPMVIVLRDGEEIHGVIEWYDKHCLKVNRTSQSNLIIYKPAISTCTRKARTPARVAGGLATFDTCRYF